MGEFKERSMNAAEEFNKFLEDEVGVVKKQFPLIPIQAAKMMALENILPAYIEYRIQLSMSNKGDKKHATRNKQSHN